MKTKETRGITLISLVVTMIVLIILAGVSVSMISGENGIINQTKNAKDQTQRASIEEQKQLIQISASMNTSTYLYEDSYKNQKIQVPIPEGFSVSSIDGESKAEEGLVVMDSLGNEFIWIPILDEKEYQRNVNYPSSYESYLEYTPTNSTFTDTGYLPDAIQPEIDTALSNEEAEKEAVLKYHGFYVSRYEAGNSNGKIVSKKGSNVWININYTSAKSISKNMYNTDKVQSALCSGIQWDMIMNFVNEKKDGKNETFDVKAINIKRHMGKLLQTGENESDRVENIYDLEGNCNEWVAERTNVKNEPYVNRGGYFENKYGITASVRNSNGDNEYNRKSFRVVLYVI